MNFKFFILILLFLSCEDSNEIKRSIESKEWQYIGFNDSTMLYSTNRLTRFYIGDFYLVLKPKGKYIFTERIEKDEVKYYEGNWVIEDSILKIDIDFFKYQKTNRVKTYRVKEVSSNNLELRNTESKDNNNRLLFVFNPNNVLRQLKLKNETAF